MLNCELCEIDGEIELRDDIAVELLPYTLPEYLGVDFLDDVRYN